MCSASLHAQYDKATWLFEVVGGPVSPSNPTVTVNLYAAFPQLSPSTSYGQGDLAISSTDPTGWFHGMTKGSGLGYCGGAILGVPNQAGGVDELGFFQIGVLGCAPNTYNPIHIWEAEWTTDNFKPRTVTLASFETTFFNVFLQAGNFFPDVFLYPDKFEHGSGVIQVVPAPGSIACIGAALVASRRRRF